MLSDTLVADILSRGRAAGADLAELYVERWKRRNLRVLNGEAKEATSGLECGAGLRLFYGTEIAYGYTNDLTAEGLRELAATLTARRGQTGRVDAKGRGGLDFRRSTAQGLHDPEIPFETHPKRYRLERLLEAESAARVAPEITQVESHLAEWEQETLVCNSEGAWVEDRRVRTRLNVNAIAQDGPQMQTGVAVSLIYGVRRTPPTGFLPSSAGLDSPVLHHFCFNFQIVILSWQLPKLPLKHRGLP